MYLKTWTLSWGQQVACHPGWKGLLGIQPASGENSEDAGARIQGQGRWHRVPSARSCTWSLPTLGAQRTGQLPMAGGPPLQFCPGLCGACCSTIIDYCLRTRAPQKKRYRPFPGLLFPLLISSSGRRVRHAWKNMTVGTALDLRH